MKLSVYCIIVSISILIVDEVFHHQYTIIFSIEECYNLLASPSGFSELIAAWLIDIFKSRSREMGAMTPQMPVFPVANSSVKKLLI